MRAENFRGIVYVRISNLPEDQKTQIWQSLERDKIIRIFRENTLLNDCVLYQDYLSWLEQQKVPNTGPKAEQASTPIKFRMAFR
ncbi:MAG: hypothetical protein JST14_14020 [Bacteroidetes bacterium]|nr:hypothetical protein [Bacteroidota bacterium]